MAFRNRIRPIIALRAIRESNRDPDDTVAAIKVIGAISGNSGRRKFKRFQRSPRGARILREKRDLYDVLTDVERMKAMPPGSLGRTIIEWFLRENISAEGLAEASAAAATALGRRDRGEDERIYNSRMRNLHDVFHVLAGYDRDLHGESAVLAFTIAQDYDRGLAYFVWRSLREAGWSSETGKLIREAYRRGKRAAPLAEQEWEVLFERPIDDVREELGVGAPPVYEQMRSAGAPALST